MKAFVYIILFVNLTLFQVQAQNKIEGFYNNPDKTFRTQNNIYWIDYFHDGIARISRNGYVGLIDSSGLILCEPKYDKIFDFNGNSARVCLNGKFGIIDKKGDELRSPDIYRLSEFSEGLANFREKNTWASRGRPT